MNSKIKLISFLLIASLLLPVMNLGTVAATEIGHVVGISSGVTGIGKEVVITVALTGYSAESDLIRGLQIDIENVDTDILSLVSYNSLIVDSTADSNKVSYSQGKSRIRLVYANFTGNLPVSADENGETWVLAVAFRINSSLEADGQINLPVSVKIQTSSEQIVSKSVCPIRYERVPDFEVRLPENSDIEYSGFRRKVTVNSSYACIAAYKDANGNYSVLKSQNNGDGSYTYEAPVGVEEVIISVKGDYNADGKLTEDDVVSLKNAVLGKAAGYNTETYVYDISEDGKITALDLALINAAVNNKISLW